MKKSKAYFYILIIALVIILAGFLLHIPFIKSLTHGTLHALESSWIAAIAAICSFIFLGNRHYWLFLLACAILTGLLLPLIGGHHTLSAFKILVSGLAFMTVAYTLNYIRLIIGK